MRSLIIQIPNFLTLCNLMCGVSALLFYDKIGINYSIVLVLAAMIFDLFDGWVARLLHVSSELGKQLDSLADVVSFGVVPTYLYSQTLDSQNTWIILSMLLFPAAGCLRLAIFNVSTDQSSDFMGMPIPAGAASVLSLIIASPYLTEWILVVLPIIFSILMVSHIRFYSTKSIRKQYYTRFFLGINALLGGIVYSIESKLSLLVVVVSFIILSILYHFVKTDNH